MPDLLDTSLDADATDALREILADPSLPVGTTFTGVSESEGRRIAALREAHDYLVSRRLAARAQSVDAAATLLADLVQVDPALSTLRWHSVVAPVLASLPPSRARNAILGDVHRGDLLTWATTVRQWTWRDGTVPWGDHPIGRADAEFELDEHPGLYDSIVLWDNAAGVLVLLPTHRERVSWEQADSGGWIVRLTGATLHADELIALDSDPRHLPEWVKP